MTTLHREKKDVSFFPFGTVSKPPAHCRAYCLFCQLTALLHRQHKATTHSLTHSVCLSVSVSLSLSLSHALALTLTLSLLLSLSPSHSLTLSHSFSLILPKTRFSLSLSLSFISPTLSFALSYSLSFSLRHSSLSLMFPICSVPMTIEVKKCHCHVSIRILRIQSRLSSAQLPIQYSHFEIMLFAMYPS